MAKTMTLAGPIEQMNDRGICVDGQWVNWSKFGEGPDPFLSDGMPVTVIATESGWIKTVETGTAKTTRERLGSQPKLIERPAHLDREGCPPGPAKVTQSELIARQSMLKASCMFWQGQQVTTQIICDFADELVKHVLRGV